MHICNKMQTATCDIAALNSMIRNYRKELKK